uniref:restriction endonuclease n=1 Tax=Halorubrum halodurans TaxID=1383851 RepID=UPI001FE58A6E|nr:restriction endonuclease [Halorubrum halodurans]
MGEKELLGWLAGYTKRRVENTHNRVKLNLNLLDYLGNYTDGPDLPDIGLFQPSASNLLDATTEEYDKLRVGDVRAERDGTSVTVSATARYKPDDDDAHETDTYGYTETDFFEAFTLVDLTENEAALVEAFVPVAVDEAGGFAGFRENATKTNSLLDRLKAITLPDPDDVADDLRRYVQTRERADELDARIAKTDELIDEIVYDLYDLTDEEIEIVESAVGE